MSRMPFRPQPGAANHSNRGRTPPPEDTFEEASFLKALGEKQKPVSVKLMDGQTFRGRYAGVNSRFDIHDIKLVLQSA